MAKFAQYYIRFNQEAGCYDWEDRQIHLGQLFAQDDSIKFDEGEGAGYIEYRHRVYHLGCNHDIIVMRFANERDVPLEKNFEATATKDEPSCFIIIDNRKGMRSVAIQYRKKAFNRTAQVASIMQYHLSQHLFNDHCYTLDIKPDYYPEDLFEAWSSLQQHIAAVRFGVPEMTQEEIEQKVAILKSKGKDYYEDSLMAPLLKIAFEAKRANYKQFLTVTPEEKKTALYLDKNTAYMRNLISISAAADMPVELITTDGASFKCYVDADSENAEKIVHREFNTELLEFLFDSKKKKNGEEVSDEDRNNIEQKIVEFMNSMVHESKDQLLAA